MTFCLMDKDQEWKQQNKNQLSEFVIGQEDNALYIKYGGIANEKCILLQLLV